MNERDYFEQFTGDVEPYYLPYNRDDLPAFSGDCPKCHGFGHIFKELRYGWATEPCPRCWALVEQ